MSKDKSNDPSKPLVDSYADADRVYGALEDAGRLLIETVRQQRDMGDAMIKFARFADRFGGIPEPLRAAQISAVNRSADSARMLEKSMRESLGLFTSTASSTGNTTVAFVTGAAVLEFCQGIELREAHSELVSSLNVVFDRGELASKVRASMLRLGLDRSASGRKSPIQLLDEAQSLMSRPASDDESPLGAFLALRSAVTDSLEALLRRAPGQESIKGVGKIVSIGRRCGKHGLAGSQFERLQREWGDLNDKLSDGKTAHLPRPSISLIFYNGLMFLRALLGAIDEGLLKPAS